MRLDPMTFGVAKKNNRYTTILHHPGDMPKAKLALSEDFNLAGLVAPSNQLDRWT